MDKEICDLFTYEEGVLYWKHKFKKSGERIKAGTSKDRYIRISVNGKFFYAHRIIFFMHHGYLPKILDHINRNRCDNRIENLRPATSTQNLFNTKVRASATNTKGVSTAPKNRFRAYINVNKKQKFLGIYATLEEAKNVRIKAAKQFFGEYANEWV